MATPTRPELKRKTRRVISALSSLFGPARWQPDGRDPLSSLILTMLSQNTTDANRDLAYGRLRERLPSWEDVMRASPRTIEAAIRPGGLAGQKSRRIRDLLRWLKKTRGKLSADFLKDLDLKGAQEVIGHLKGIGPKTLSVVLMFTFGKDAFPVDTHVHRVCLRLGLIPGNCSAEKAHFEMAALLPPGKAYSTHIHMWKFGKHICQARKPHCWECPLVKECVYPLKNLPGRKKDAPGPRRDRKS